MKDEENAIQINQSGKEEHCKKYSIIRIGNCINHFSIIFSHFDFMWYSSN